MLPTIRKCQLGSCLSNTDLEHALICVPKVSIAVQYVQTDPRAPKFGELIREVVSAQFDIAICDKCRRDDVKMQKIKSKFCYDVWQFAQKRGKKKVTLVDDTVTIEWSRNTEAGPPAPPPGVEMEIKMGELNA